MPELRAVTLTARQPLSLGTRHNPGTVVHRTHRHVRGTTLRGALAQVWIAHHGRPDQLATTDPALLDRFVELFERHVRYGPLYPDGWSLVPLSVRRCKYRTEPGCARWSADEAFEAEGGAEACGVCGGPAEPSKGRLERWDADDPRPLLRQSTHVELTPEGVAAKGQLYAREAIRAGTTFTGELTLPDDLSAPAREWLVAERSVRLGGRGSTSGLATFATRPAPTRPPATGRRLALRFTSPGLLVDACGLPALGPSEEELSDLLGTGVTITRVWVRHERVGGWNRATNLPKPEELAVSAGSTFLLACEREPQPARLAALHAAGLGLRRNEGYGSVRVDAEPWTPPPPRPTATAEAETGAAGPEAAGTGAGEAGGTAEDDTTSPAGIARVLNDTGYGPWLLNKLRDYVSTRRSGRAPHTDLLAATTLRAFRPSHRDLLERLLLTDDLGLLDEVVRHLNVLVRRG